VTLKCMWKSRWAKMTEHGFSEYNIISVRSRDSCQFVRAILIIVLMNHRFPVKNNISIYFTSEIIIIIVIIIVKVHAGTSDYRFSLVVRYSREISIHFLHNNITNIVYCAEWKLWREAHPFFLKPIFQPALCKSFTDRNSNSTRYIGTRNIKIL